MKQRAEAKEARRLAAKEAAEKKLQNMRRKSGEPAKGKYC